MKNSLRHLGLSLSLLVGVAAFSAATAAPISSAGGGSLEDRVGQLERVSNAHGQVLTQLQQQLADLQRDIDNLRGQIQQNQYQLDQAVERQKDLYQKLDSASSAQGQKDNTAASANAATNNVTQVTTGNENQDYNNAVALVMEKKDFDGAITAFQNFIKQYPKSNYLANANYWLGQSYFSKGQKDTAASYFATVVKEHPKSPKSSDALYKVGLILQEKGQKDNAKAIYQQVVTNYPNTDSAKLAQKRISALQ